MSHDDLAKLRTKGLATLLGRLAVLKGQQMMRALRQDRARERKKGGTHRLIKEFRAMKSLLLAEQRRLEAPRHQRALTRRAARSTTSR
jgi:hypothetical protein